MHGTPGCPAGTLAPVPDGRSFGELPLWVPLALLALVPVLHALSKLFFLVRRLVTCSCSG
jgi:hypothetical protein